MTRDEIKTRLSTYLAAEAAILKAQEYVIGQGATARRLRRPDLPGVQEEIRNLQLQIDQIDSAAAQRGRRITYLRPF